MRRIGGAFVAIALSTVALPTAAFAGTDFWETDPTDKAYSRFGHSIDVVGDVSGDGIDDVLVGASLYDTVDADINTPGEGRAYLFLGGTPDGPAATPVWTADPTNESGARFGASVAGLGDVTGDGKPDVIIGAPRFGPGDTGRAYVYAGTGTEAGLSATPVWEDTPADALPNQRFGFSVSAAGDVNNDDNLDALIGGEGGSGAAATAYIYEGLDLPAALGSDPAWFESRGGFTGTGIEVASAGDLDDDGFGDVLIGFYGFPQVSENPPDPGGPFNEGRTYIFRGAAAWPEHAPDWFTSLGNADDARYGIGVSAGDVTGDGKEDIAISANGVQRAWLFLGGTPTDTEPTGVSREPAWEMNRPDGFGRSLDIVGDVDGDGKADLAVGAPQGPNFGSVELFRGTETGLSLLAAGTFGGPISTGESVAGGDIDDDGLADVVTGAPTYSGPNDLFEEGQARGRFNIDADTDVVPPADPVLKNLPAFQKKTKFNVGWPNSEDAAYELQVKSASPKQGFTAFESVAVDPGLKSVKFTGTPGRSYCFRVRSTDNIGNYSDYSDQKCTAVPLDDRALKGRGWQRKSSKGYFLKTYTLQSAKGKSLNLSGIDVRRVGLVATKCPTCGKVRVKVGSEPPVVANLKAPRKRKKQIIPIAVFGQLEHGGLKISIVTDRKRVEVDGVGLARF